MGAEYSHYLGRTQGSPERAMLVIATNCIFKSNSFLHSLIRQKLFFRFFRSGDDGLGY